MTTAPSCTDRPDDEFAMLLTSLTDDTISAEEEIRLGEILENDQQARDHYYEFMQIHSFLSWQMHLAKEPLDNHQFDIDQQAEIEDVHSTVHSTGLLGFINDSVVSFKSAITQPLGLSILMAAFSVTCLIFTLAIIYLPIKRIDPADSTAQKAKLKPVANVVSVLDCQWKDNRSLAKGATVWENQELELINGVALLRLEKNDVELVIQGPAIVRFESSQSAFVSAGKVVASIPPAVMDFKIHTPLTTIIDLGTKYSIFVNDTGVTDVFVEHGKVQVDPSSRSNANFSPQILIAGESLRFEKSSVSNCNYPISTFINSSKLKFAKGLLERNLIVNSGADVGPGVKYKTNSLIYGWETTETDTRATSQLYNGTSLTRIGPGSLPYPPEHSRNLFFGGFHGIEGAAQWQISQTIDVVLLSHLIDQGKISCSLSGYFGGFFNQNDRSELKALFLNSKGEKLGEQSIGNVTAVQRHNKSGLLLCEGKFLLPKETNNIQLLLLFKKEKGKTCDAAADNLSLKLEIIEPDL